MTQNNETPQTSDNCHTWKKFFKGLRIAIKNYDLTSKEAAKIFMAGLVIWLSGEGKGRFNK